MSEILFVLASAFASVQFGWGQLEDGQYEAILQIEPEVLAELSRPGGQQEITSDVPRELWTARRLRITSTIGGVPRDGQPRAARRSEETTFENESVVYLDSAALDALADSKDVIFTLPANIKGVKRYRIIAGDPPRQPAASPPSSGNPLRSPPGGTSFPPPTDRSQGDPSRVLPGPERRGGAAPADDGWSDRWDPPAADPWPGAENAYPRDQYPPPSSQAPPYQDPAWGDPAYGRTDPYNQDPRSYPPAANDDPRNWPPGYDPRYAATDPYYRRPGSIDPRTADDWGSRPPRDYDPYAVPPTGSQVPADENKPAPRPISITLPKISTAAPREAAHFWPLTFSLLGFFAASGGVIFLGWMNYNFRRQYQLLLSRLRSRRVLAAT